MRADAATAPLVTLQVRTHTENDAEALLEQYEPLATRMSAVIRKLRQRPNLRSQTDRITIIYRLNNRQRESVHSVKNN